MRWMDLLVAVALLAGLAALSGLIRGEWVDGDVRVVDGDTLAFGSRRVRLHGVDAPELGQTCRRSGTDYPCGAAARDELRDLTRGQPVACRIRGHDRFGRDLGTCRARDLDLGAELVRRGLVLASGAYEAEERQARRNKVGLWAGSFERPSEWRKRHASAEAL